MPSQVRSRKSAYKTRNDSLARPSLQSRKIRGSAQGCTTQTPAQSTIQTNQTTYKKLGSNRKPAALCTRLKSYLCAFVARSFFKAPAALSR